MYNKAQIPRLTEADGLDYRACQKINYVFSILSGSTYSQGASASETSVDRLLSQINSLRDTVAQLSSRFETYAETNDKDLSDLADTVELFQQDFDEYVASQEGIIKDLTDRLEALEQQLSKE